MGGQLTPRGVKGIKGWEGGICSINNLLRDRTLVEVSHF